MPTPDTSQVLFRREYEHELEAWLRRRFTYLCITYGVLGLVNVLTSIAALVGMSANSIAAPPFGGTVITAVEGILWVVIVAVFYLRRGRHESREDLLGAVWVMILAVGAVTLASRFIAEWAGLVFTGSTITSIFFWHFTACLFLPWTPRDSLRPILPLLAVWALYTLLMRFDMTLIGRIISIMFSPGILIPGLLICGWRLRRHSRQFRSTMLGQQFNSMRQEFSRARRIHESLFPSEYDDGYVKLQYSYAPMRELGGDFLHVHVGAEGIMHVTLMDVTGHGLAAALTVNRIYGELDRIRAESPKASPGEVLGLINRYLRLTMVKHNIYATAITLRLDPYVGEICWASAGHPPAFLRGANAAVKDLPATAVVLGAMTEEDFEPQEQHLELAPGDVIVAYTDGAFEARDRTGRQLGLERLRGLMEQKPAPVNWTQAVRDLVEQHKVGRAEDDVLVAAIKFSSYRMRKTAPAALATP